MSPPVSSLLLNVDTRASRKNSLHTKGRWRQLRAWECRNRWPKNTKQAGTVGDFLELRHQVRLTSQLQSRASEDRAVHADVLSRPLTMVIRHLKFFIISHSLSFAGSLSVSDGHVWVPRFFTLNLGTPYACRVIVSNSPHVFRYLINTFLCVKAYI